MNETIAVFHLWLMKGGLGLIVLFLLLCLIRAVRGPEIADRIIAINMMGTLTMIAIALLAVLLKEGYLMDIALIYAMLSFLAVVLMTKIYLGVWRQRQESERPDAVRAEEKEDAHV